MYSIVVLRERDALRNVPDELLVKVAVKREYLPSPAGHRIDIWLFLVFRMIFGTELI